MSSCLSSSPSHCLMNTFWTVFAHWSCAVWWHIDDAPGCVCVSGVSNVFVCKGVRTHRRMDTSSSCWHTDGNGGGSSWERYCSASAVFPLSTHWCCHFTLLACLRVSDRKNRRTVNIYLQWGNTYDHWWHLKDEFNALENGWALFVKVILKVVLLPVNI